jgi:hypothetical protein
MQRLTAVKNVAGEIADLHETVLKQVRLRVRVVALFEAKCAMGVKVKQALYRLHILDLVMKYLPFKQNVLEDEDSRDVDREDAGKDSNEPNGNTSADVGGVKKLHCPGSRRMKPTPRRVCRSLTGNGSSILRRRRVICTSITLSIGVKREVSRQTSFASISRETA